MFFKKKNPYHPPPPPHGPATPAPWTRGFKRKPTVEELGNLLYKNWMPERFEVWKFFKTIFFLVARKVCIPERLFIFLVCHLFVSFCSLFVVFYSFFKACFENAEVFLDWVFLGCVYHRLGDNATMWGEIHLGCNILDASNKHPKSCSCLPTWAPNRSIYQQNGLRLCTILGIHLTRLVKAQQKFRRIRCHIHSNMNWLPIAPSTNFFDVSWTDRSARKHVLLESCLKKGGHCHSIAVKFHFQVCLCGVCLPAQLVAISTLLKHWLDRSHHGKLCFRKSLMELTHRHPLWCTRRWANTFDMTIRHHGLWNQHQIQHPLPLAIMTQAFNTTGIF